MPALCPGLRGTQASCVKQGMYVRNGKTSGHAGNGERFYQQGRESDARPRKTTLGLQLLVHGGGERGRCHAV